MSYKKDLGSFGEDSAALYYQNKGYNISERNYYTRYGEIDLIVEKNDQIVFVEVKTRTSHSYGIAEQTITAQKRERMAMIAKLYIEEHELNELWPRLDLFILEFVNNQEKILVYENI